MKTLLSIIVALALLVAFSMPAMASGGTGSDRISTGGAVSGSAVANDGSTAIRGSNIGNDNRRYDDDNNAVAVAELTQANTITASRSGGTTGYVRIDDLNDRTGDIDVRGSIRNFAGIANANLNTGAISNQAIQNNVAARVSSGRDSF